MARPERGPAPERQITTVPVPCGAVKPFILLATRPEDATADSEYEAMLRVTGLTESEFRRIRLESAPMPDLDLDGCSGIVVGGSPFTTSVPREHKSDTQLRVETELGELLDRLVPLDHPFFGACFGIGTLVTHQGGVVDGTYAEPLGSAHVSVTEEGRLDPLLEGVPDSFDVYLGHKEACTRMPPGAVVLARSPRCPVQMLRMGSNVYATQFHPELDLEGLELRMRVYRHAGYFEPEEFDAVLTEAAKADVGVVARTLRNFVERYAR